MVDSKRRRTHDFAAMALAATLAGCHRSSGSHHSSPPPASSSVGITSPSSADAIVWSADTIDLAGWAELAAWNSDESYEPHVRVVNDATGASAWAVEHVDWVWFFGWYPTNHTWSATVPLVPGANAIAVEAVDSTTNRVLGTDRILVSRS